jgi:hypothetical protein
MELIDWSQWRIGKDLRVPEVDNTPIENLRASQENLDTARRALAAAKLRVSRIHEPGPELQHARREVARCKSDVAHWNGYVGYFKREATKYEQALIVADRNRRAANDVEW